MATEIYGSPAAGAMDRVGIIALAVLIAAARIVATLRQLGGPCSASGRLTQANATFKRVFAHARTPPVPAISQRA